MDADGLMLSGPPGSGKTTVARLVAASYERAGAAGVVYANLRPQLDIAVHRAQTRSPAMLSDPALIRRLWADFDDLDAWLESHVLDTTAQTPDETARSVSRRLCSGALDI